MKENPQNQKIAIVCPNFTPKNENKQPWRYFLEIGKYFGKCGYNVIFITDRRTSFESELFNVLYVEKLFNKTSVSASLRDTLSNFQPACTILRVTPSIFLRGKVGNQMPGTIIGVVSSTKYKLRELTRLGVKTNYNHHEYMDRFFIESMLPKRIVERSISSFDEVVSLSEFNKNRLESYYQDKIHVIPPGIEDRDLEIPAEKEVPWLSESKPSILYFTSPLTLRGTDVLTKSFCQIHKQKDCELVLLSRPDSDKMNDEEAYLYNIAKKGDVSGDFHLISKFLDNELIRSCLHSADIVCLPYKIVISEVPISLYEAQAMGSPVISTDVSCIPEVIKHGGLVVPPNNISATTEALNRLLEDKDLRNNLGTAGREAMLNHNRWNDVGQSFRRLLYD